MVLSLSFNIVIIANYVYSTRAIGSLNFQLYARSCRQERQRRQSVIPRAEPSKRLDVLLANIGIAVLSRRLEFSFAAIQVELAAPIA